MVWKTAFVMVVAFFLAPGCSDDDNPVTPIPELIPLAVGNSWVYAVHVVRDGEDVYHGFDTVRVVGENTFPDGTTWYDLGVWDSGWGTVYFGNTSRGHEYREYEPSLIYPYPASPGEYTLNEGGEEQYTIRVVSIDETFASSAGTLSCYHFRTIRADVDTTDTWCAPGIGRVRMTTSLVHAPHQIDTWELREYHLLPVD